MKKPTKKPLALDLQTVRALDRADQLDRVAGAATQICTFTGVWCPRTYSQCIN